jgi:hypothetical protein
MGTKKHPRVGVKRHHHQRLLVFRRGILGLANHRLVATMDTIEIPQNHDAITSGR